MHSVEQGCRIGLSAHSRPAGGCRSGAGGCACKISQRKASSMHNKHMMQNVCSSIISRPHPPLKTANTENAWFVSTGHTAHTSELRSSAWNGGRDQFKVSVLAAFTLRRNGWRQGNNAQGFGEGGLRFFSRCTSGPVDWIENKRPMHAAPTQVTCIHA